MRATPVPVVGMGPGEPVAVALGCVCKLMLSDGHGGLRWNVRPTAVLRADCPVHGLAGAEGSAADTCVCGWSGVALKDGRCPVCKAPATPGEPVAP